MDSKHKEYLWVGIVIGFYVLTGYFGVYDISQMILWPILAMPMSLLLVKTGEKEVVALVGVMLSIIISVISTGGLHPIVISVFLLFILAPSFVFALLYRKKENIPKIIILTTLVVFLNGIIFLIFTKLLGIDYLDIYFSGLDGIQMIWNEYLADVEVQKLLPEGEDIEMYARAMTRTILQAKRTYPATLFTIGLVTSTMHLLITQLIARIGSWERPAMSEILRVGLSPAAAWVLLGLWIVTIQMGNTDNTMVFATESMLSVLFTLFQIMGLISMIVMIKRIGTRKIYRILLTAISIFWLLFNPTLLVMIGCMDSIFNFRKVKTLI